MTRDALRDWLKASLPVKEVFLEQPYQEDRTPAAELWFANDAHGDVLDSRLDVETYFVRLIPPQMGTSANQRATDIYPLMQALLASVHGATRINPAWRHITARFEGPRDQTTAIAIATVQTYPYNAA